MKYLLATVFAVITLMSHAQTAEKTLKNGFPKDARIISLKSPKTDTRFDEVTKILFRNNFEITKSDRSTGLIQTKLTHVKGGFIRLYISMIGDEIDVRSDASFDSVGGHGLTNSGSAKGLNQLMFVEMDKIARMFPQTAIEYLK